MSSFEPLNPSPSPSPLPLLAGRNYHCQCGQPVFFRNSQCLACGTPLGYDCEKSVLLPLMPADDPTAAQASGLWQAWQPEAVPLTNHAPPSDTPPPRMEDIPGQQSGGSGGLGGSGQSDDGVSPSLAPVPGQAPASSASAAPDASASSGGEPAIFYKRCLNLLTPAACNWLIAADDTHDMCRACRLNRTIPDLADANFPDNGYLWGKVELAKRRLVSALIALQLPVASRMTEDLQRGLMFDFLRSPLNGPHVMTGHDTGLITLNVDEADDVKREAVRKAMREPYRTLLGHFRHEVGHYYWDRLVAGTVRLDGFRQLFGDESTDYAAALKLNYEQGPPSDWPLHFVSAYASTHPWEDWAECWAHYLHMRDTVDTALSFGLSVEQFNLEFTPFTMDAVYLPDHPDAAQFLGFLNHWMRLTTMLNEMSRSMGQPDFYPFVLPRDVVAKLHFIHLVVIGDTWAPQPVQEASNAPETTDFKQIMPLAQ